MEEQIRSFIITVRRKAMSDILYAKASTRSAGYLSGLIIASLKNKENRIPVLEMIIGFPIESSKDLTHVYVSVLIEEILYERRCNVYPSTISLIEGYIENHPNEKPYHLFNGKRV